MPARLSFARFETRGDGYRRWRSFEDGRERYVYAHRLLACLTVDAETWAAEGTDALADHHVHHVHGRKWLNALDLPVPELPDGPLLELREPDEHARHHDALGEYRRTADADGAPA